ncbi:MAG TPA: hypothetical protein VL359_04195, partial [bacterium]|nr:hypothetical protein [bacterium]
ADPPRALPVQGVVLVCALALALAGISLFQALRAPQLYVLRLDDQHVQQARPNPDPARIYADFARDVLTQGFTFNPYTRADSQAFLERYAEEPALNALLALRQPLDQAEGPVSARLTVTRVEVRVREGHPTALVDAVWSRTVGDQTITTPLHLALTLTGRPQVLAHHVRLAVTAVQEMTP